MITPHTVAILQVVGLLQFGRRTIVVVIVIVHPNVYVRILKRLIPFKTLAIVALYGHTLLMRTALRFTAASVQSDSSQRCLVEQFVVLACKRIAAIRTTGMSIIILIVIVTIVHVSTQIPAAIITLQSSAEAHILIRIGVIGFRLT